MPALFPFFALTTGGKIYYLAGTYIYLLGVGAVAIDGWLAARTGRLRLLAAPPCPADGVRPTAPGIRRGRFSPRRGTSGNRSRTARWATSWWPRPQ